MGRGRGAVAGEKSTTRCARALMFAKDRKPTPHACASWLSHTTNTKWRRHTSACASLSARARQTTKPSAEKVGKSAHASARASASVGIGQRNTRLPRRSRPSDAATTAAAASATTLMFGQVTHAPCARPRPGKSGRNRGAAAGSVQKVR